MSQLLLSRKEWTKCTPSTLTYNFDHIICPGLSILFLYVPAHKSWIFEKFVFELETFSCDFKIDCILLWLLMSLNRENCGVIRKISHFYFMICYNCRVSISENCKYFIATLIYNNIVIGHPQWTPTIRVKVLDKETTYFTFRLDTDITNFDDMDEFAPVTKHERQRK